MADDAESGIGDPDMYPPSCMRDDDTLMAFKDLTAEQDIDPSDVQSRNAIHAWARSSLSATPIFVRMLSKCVESCLKEEQALLAQKLMYAQELDEMERCSEATDMGLGQTEQDEHVKAPVNLRLAVGDITKANASRAAMLLESAKLARERGPRSTARGLSAGSPGHAGFMVDSIPGPSGPQVQIQSSMKLLESASWLRSISVTSCLMFVKAVDALRIKNQDLETDMMTLIDPVLHTRIIQLFNEQYPLGGPYTVAMEPLNLNNFYTYTNLPDSFRGDLKSKNEWVSRELLPTLMLTHSEQEAAQTFHKICKDTRLHYAKCSLGQQEPVLEALAQNLWLLVEALYHVQRCVAIKCEGKLHALAHQDAPLTPDESDLLGSNFPRLYIRTRDRDFEGPSGATDAATGKAYSYAGFADDIERQLIPKSEVFLAFRVVAKEALRLAQDSSLKTPSNPLRQLEDYLAHGIRILGERLLEVKGMSKSLAKLCHFATKKLEVSIEIVPQGSHQPSSLNQRPTSSSSQHSSSSQVPPPSQGRRQGFSSPRSSQSSGSGQWKMGMRRVPVKNIFGAMVDEAGDEDQEQGEDDQDDDDDEPHGSSELEALETEMRAYEDAVGWGGMPESDPETMLFAFGAEISAAQGEMAYCAMTRSQTTQDPRHAQPSNNQLSQRAMAQGQLSAQEMKLRACRAWIDGKCKHVVSPRNCEWSHEVGPLHRAYEYKAGFKDKISGEADKIHRFIKSLGPDFQLKR